MLFRSRLSEFTLKVVKNADDPRLKNVFLENNTIYVQDGIYAMSSRKIESLKRIAYMQKYYQCNPVRFIDDFFNIELLDAQSYIVQRSWNCPNVLVTATRGLGKSTIIDLILMSKGMLFCNYWAYIASGSGSQAEQTFTTLERIANDNIDEMMGSTGYIFKQEVEVKNAAGDGFSHSSNGFTYSTYNGSKTQTLNSNVDAKRGSHYKKASLYRNIHRKIGKEIWKAEMPIRVEGYISKYSHTQRIGVETNCDICIFIH